jgi:N-hydroxyarylamine O-acetyltransferase
MNLNAYLERIQYSGRCRVDYETLASVHHQHLLHIPYENIDVQLGYPLDFDLDRIFNKLVTARRGGWCYEMNGLLGWALDALGFDVTRMCAGVGREKDGNEEIGNHLILGIDLAGKKYLADVGLGDGARHPIPISQGVYEQGGLTYGLKQMTDGYWRFRNHHLSNTQSFDFEHLPADETVLTNKCHWLQVSPESPFTKVMIVQRFTPATIEIQLGKIHTTITPDGKASRELSSIDELNANLADVFGLDIDISPAWERIIAGHERLLGINKPS